jgi:orotidine-5'-phosphate decarboxylase
VPRLKTKIIVAQILEITKLHFTKKLKIVLRETNSHLCIGLDADLRKLPAFLKSSSNPLYDFNSLVIEATKDLVCAYKLNIAFYEVAGEIGWQVIRDTLKLIPEELITIADAKRGDIENTSELYARTFFDEFGFDSITIHPYMGSDSVRPFIRRKNKFVFLLALTSNYGSNDFQHLKINKQSLYEVVIEKALSWNDHKIGFVVGANYDRELKSITKKYPDTPILVPGIGAQKNSLSRTVTAIQHNLFLINQSRSIIYSAPKAENAEQFQEIVRDNAMKARDEINKLFEEKK